MTPNAEGSASTANIVYRLNLIQPKVDKIYEDMYIGNGPDHPSITLRMDRQEKLMQDRQKRDDRAHSYMMKAFFLLLATFLTLVGNLVVSLFKHT